MINRSEHYSVESLKTGRKVTLAGVLVNFFLILFKFFTGIFGHSQALIADAIHSVSDLFTDAVVFFGLKIGSKEPDEEHHFGHARIETLASGIIGLALIATALYIGVKAALDIYSHHSYHPTTLALFGAGLSIILKEVLYRYTVAAGRRIKSQVIIANAWHHRSDAFSSIAVLLGVAGAQIRPSWNILDGIATLVVSLFIIKVALEILRNTLREFTDTAPKPEIMDKMKMCALEVNGVIDVHDLRVRTSGGMYQMEIHIGVDGKLTVTEGHRVAEKVEQCLEKEVKDVDSIIVHVDPAMFESDQES